MEFIMKNTLLRSDLSVSLFSKKERFNTEEGKITVFIIWQGSLEVNTSSRIGSFLAGILPYGPFLWKLS